MMTIKTIEYNVDIAGITPATEQFGCTQGDHKTTSINFTLSTELLNAVAEATGDSKVLYRFDIYDGEGGIWSSDATELSSETVSIELEERHTRHGGKITVYLVISALSSENATEMELYTFPAVLRLKNKPEGIAKDGESYESVSSLAQVTKAKALEAAESALLAKNAASYTEQTISQAVSDAVSLAADEAENAKESALAASDALANINTAIADSTDQAYDPTSKNAQSGIAVAEAIRGIKGEQGADGLSAYEVAVNNGFEGTEAEWLASIKGEKGDNGSIENVDQSYNSESEYPQSGKAVAEAVIGKVDKITPQTRFTIDEMVEGSKGLYCADWGGTKLVKLDYDKTPYTVPYRMENGHIIVGMVGKNRDTNASEIFRGCALPHTFLTQEVNYLESLISAAQTTANTAQSNANNKKITSCYTYAKTTLDWNCVYVIWSSSGDADIELYNSATGAKVTDTAGEELPSTQVCVLLLPKENYTTITSASTTQTHTQKRCVLFGTTGKMSLTNLNTTVSKQFLIGDGDLYFTPTSNGASVYKIGL